MPTIGIFKLTRNGYDGMITTLTLCTPAQIVPNKRKQSDASPDFFIKSADSDLGVAWKSVSKGEHPKEYLRIILDDPSFAAPINAALFDRENGADLVWNRRNVAAARNE